MDQSCTKEEGETQPLKTPALKSPPICIRCRTKISNILVIRSAYCRECFDNFFEHRFKINLTRARTSEDKRQQLRILIALSGGPSSRAILHLLHQMVFATRKKIFVTFAAAFIDEGALLDLPDSEREENRRQVAELCESYKDKIPLFIHNLEDVFKGVPHDVANLSETSEESKEENGEVDTKKTLRDLMNGIPSLTSREDILIYLRNQLLYRIAMENGFECIMRGESATRLAIRTISATCKGRGFALPLEVGHSDTRYPGVNFVQPLRDFLDKEIIYYNRIHNLRSVFIPTLGTTKSVKASINLLAEDFVMGLQSEFSHTVHTILRTTEKLLAPPHTLKDDAKDDSEGSSETPQATDESETASSSSSPKKSSDSPACHICRLSIRAQEALTTSVGFKHIATEPLAPSSSENLCFPCRQQFAAFLAQSGAFGLLSSVATANTFTS